MPPISAFKHDNSKTRQPQQISEFRKCKMEIEEKQIGRGGAEAVLNIQPNSSISIAYHTLFGAHDDLMLLELDEKLIPDILNQRVTVRGQQDEDAVLCTESKTYAVKFVGTSNSVFLMPPYEESHDQTISHDINDNSCDGMVIGSVLKVATGVMELVEAAPKLDKLKLLLSQRPYSFEDESEMEDSELSERNIMGLYRWDDLVELVQASNEELRSGLEALSAVEINSYWRILDGKYVDRMLDMFFLNVEQHKWALNALNENEVITELEADGYPQTIAKHCLQVYCSKLGEGSRMWKLDERRVCVHYARGILGGHKMKLETFMEMWIQKVPNKMCPTFDMLEGEVLTERIGIEARVYAFSVSSLPLNPAERFSKLFMERPKWEWKDLQPYIRDLKVPGLSSEGILLKYTRRTQPTADADPIFSAR
ncbi:hypothetical protein Leryth_006841 [Lithospermum erythrorhizon]|nr:hypothetical protein Leryth_006841 [Lithospermum erythrorhizon]